MAPPRNGGPPELTTAVIGLDRSLGVLPRLYTEVVTGRCATARGAARFSRHAVAPLCRVVCPGPAIKYRINRSAETAATAGRRRPIGWPRHCWRSPALRRRIWSPRLAVGARAAAALFRVLRRPTALRREAGGAGVGLARAARSRSCSSPAPGLSSAPDQRTTLAAGPSSRRLEPARGRCRDRGARLGPAGAHRRAHRPARPAELRGAVAGPCGLQRLVSLVRAFLGFEIGFAVNPVLAGPRCRRCGSTRGPTRRRASAGTPGYRRRRARRRARAATRDGRAVRGGDRRGRRAGQAGGGIERAAARIGAAATSQTALSAGYYRHQSPLHLNLACLLGGVAGVEARSRRHHSPIWSLAAAQGLARSRWRCATRAGRSPGSTSTRRILPPRANSPPEAGIDNARFIEADLAAFAETGTGRDLPQADVAPCTAFGAGSATRCGRASSGCSRPRCGPAASFRSAITRCRPGRARSACSGCCSKRAARAPRAATARSRPGSRSWRPWTRPRRSHLRGQSVSCNR